MNRTSVIPLSRLVAALGVGLAALSIAGCGKIGPLEQPAPLFGARAKAQYKADQQQAQAASQAQGASERQTTGSAERQVDQEPAPNAAGLENSMDNQVDDAPRTTRDVKDPDSEMTTPRDSPVPGEPNPGGPMPSLTPPN
jgi:predicted small lipoprotein YifL